MELPACPLPLQHYPYIVMAHGGGGRLSHQLFQHVFLPAFQNPMLEKQHDGAVFSIQDVKLAFSTDSYVIKPHFFPGGDIGALAVNGTVNDLAMCGAKPLYLSAGVILEEGFPMDHLRRVVNSMKYAAEVAGIQLVTGDTKVVDKGKGDGIYINTSGIGIIEHWLVIGPQQVQPGDAVILSGDIGRHGVAIMAVREGLAFETTIESDCAPINRPVQELFRSGVEIHCLRDLTRGGLATALVEIAETSSYEIKLEEKQIQIDEQVAGACEMLGLDPLYVANEGRFVAFVAPHDTDRALSILNSCTPQQKAVCIGKVQGATSKRVVMHGILGTNRLIDRLSGEQLPRIC